MKWSNCSPKGFAFPLAMNGSSCCSVSTVAFSVVSVLDLSYSNMGGVSYNIIVLICISLMTYDVGHLFTSANLPSAFILWYIFLFRSFTHFQSGCLFSC